MRLHRVRDLPIVDTSVKLPVHLSWSAISTISDCGYRYRLTRAHRLEGSTWFATLAGSAIHTITEYADRNEALGIVSEDQLIGAPTFKEEFDRRFAECDEKHIVVKPSGKLQKSVTVNGGPNKKNYEWWLIYGPLFIEKWIEWKKTSGFSILIMPDGSPAIELEFSIEQSGDIPPLVGFIDRVYVDSDGDVTVLDLKSGKIPDGPLQTAIYGYGLKKQYGIDAKFGMFWSPSASPPKEEENGTLPPDIGKTSKVYTLSDFHHGRIEDMAGNAWGIIKNGFYIPHQSSMCRGCTVKKLCWAYDEGYEAGSIPLKVNPVTPESVSHEVEDDEEEEGEE